MIFSTWQESRNLNDDEFVAMIDQYCRDKPTLVEMSQRVGCDRETMRKLLERFERKDLISRKVIPVYEQHGMTKADFVLAIRDMVSKDMSIPKIAKHFGTSSTTIHKWMVAHDIKRREELRNPEWLRQRYIVDQKSSLVIAAELGVTGEAVIWHLKKNGIPVRSTIEAHQCRTDGKPTLPRNPAMRGFRSYCFWYNDFFCASTAEYMFVRMELPKFSKVKAQPFVFENRRPDFLVDGNVIEVKDERRNYSAATIKAYEDYGKKVKDELGYDYQIRFMFDEYPREYRKALSWLRKYATKGTPFTLTDVI